MLAAGLGERLRPLTDTCPKPLLPVLGKSILERTLGCLAAAGVEATAVNLHHLGEQIRARLGGEFDGMPLVYSPEEVLLGTLGPLARLRDFFAGWDPVLMVNGDSLCDWPVSQMLDEHARGGAEATLLLASRPDAESFGGGVVVDDSGAVVSFRGGEPAGGVHRGVFAGFHVISASLLEGLAEVPSDIVRQLYEPFIERGGSVRAVFTDLPWHDMGTPRRYLDGCLDAASDRSPLDRSSESVGPERRIDESWYGAGAEIDPSARCVGSVVESGALVGAGATLEGSLVMPGGRVGEGSRLERVVVGPRVVVPAGTSLDHVLVTRADGGGLETKEL